MYIFLSYSSISLLTHVVKKCVMRAYTHAHTHIHNLTLILLPKINTILLPNFSTMLLPTLPQLSKSRILMIRLH